MVVEPSRCWLLICETASAMPDFSWAARPVTAAGPEMSSGTPMVILLGRFDDPPVELSVLAALDDFDDDPHAAVNASSDATATDCTARRWNFLFTVDTPWTC